MKYAKKLRKGDKVAIVSLSSGMLGEAFCSHNIEIGVKRLREYGLEPSFMPNSLKGIEYLKANPKARAKDLKDAFMDDSIAGIICAIGGDDTYRLLPYLLEDEEFIDAVHKSPKLFTGFSDTTINHLMFYKLGLSTYYGPNFICDLAEISDEMLPYSKKAFESYIEGNEYREITSSEIWYQERTDFSKEAVGTERISHREEHGFELVDVEYVKEAGNWYLRAYVDKEGGITLDDCELVNRAWSDMMDADDFIEDAYILEVSSTGLGRQLKKEKDFKRSIGEDIDLHFYKGQKIPGGKNGKEVTVKDLTGTLLAFTTDTITIQTDFAPEYVVNRSEVSKVNLTIDF